MWDDLPISQPMAARGLALARGAGAFLLNLVASITVSASIGIGASRLLRAYFPSISISQRELLVSVVFSALVAVCVCRFWETTTAKWVWAVPVPLLLFRMAFYALGHHSGSVMEADPERVWSHFFNPAFKGPYALMDFTFTMMAVRTSVYSLTARAMERWQKRNEFGAVASPSLNRQIPVPLATFGSHENSLAPATYFLIGINVLVFTAMTLSGVSPLFPRNDQLLRWGADMGQISTQSQSWRFITALFLHFGALHLVPNMAVFWWIGRLAERVFGGVLLTVTYLLTGIGAGLLGLLWSPQATQAGASGAILGIAAFLIMVAVYGKVQLPPAWKFSRRMPVVLVLFLPSAFPLSAGDIAHIGGFLSGLVLGILFSRAMLTAPAHPLIAQAMLFQGRQAIAQNSCGAALQHLQHYVAARPKSAEGHALLGYALHAAGDHETARQEYELAVELGCGDEVLKSNLAALQT